MNKTTTSLQTNNTGSSRRTSADDVFDGLRADIVKMRLLPGTRLSEAEVAKRYEVSRQPVREALIRLNNLNLVRIRPQKATIVRKISRTEITQARFVRLAIEVELATRACANYNDEQAPAFEKNLEQQKLCVLNEDKDRFNVLDYEFHSLICVAAKSEFAQKIIVDHKAIVDRLCLLSLGNQSGVQQIYQDHINIFEQLSKRDEKALIAATRKHLSRLDETLTYVQENHAEFFGD